MNQTTETTATLTELSNLLWDATAAATLGTPARHARQLDRGIVALRTGTRDGNPAQIEEALATLNAIGIDTSEIGQIADQMLEEHEMAEYLRFIEGRG